MLKKVHRLGKKRCWHSLAILWDSNVYSKFLNLEELEVNLVLLKLLIEVLQNLNLNEKILRRSSNPQTLSNLFDKIKHLAKKSAKSLGQSFLNTNKAYYNNNATKFCCQKIFLSNPQASMTNHFKNSATSNIRQTVYKSSLKSIKKSRQWNSSFFFAKQKIFFSLKTVRRSGSENILWLPKNSPIQTRHAHMADLKRFETCAILILISSD